MAHPQKRFWVFGGEFPTEPNGGMRDHLDDFDTGEEARAFARGYLARSSGWAYVYDSATGDSVDVAS